MEFLAAYTLSKTLTDNLGYYGSGGVNAEGAYWQNAYDRRGDRGPAFFDARHNFSTSAWVDLTISRWAEAVASARVGVGPLTLY